MAPSARSGWAASTSCAASACTAITLMWWATTSCRSRAMRTRSSAAARRASSLLPLGQPRGPLPLAARGVAHHPGADAHEVGHRHVGQVGLLVEHEGQRAHHHEHQDHGHADRAGPVCRHRVEREGQGELDGRVGQVGHRRRRGTPDPTRAAPPPAPAGARRAGRPGRRPGPIPTRSCARWSRRRRRRRSTTTVTTPTATASSASTASGGRCRSRSATRTIGGHRPHGSDAPTGRHQTTV